MKQVPRPASNFFSLKVDLVFFDVKYYPNAHKIKRLYIENNGTITLKM